MCVCVCVCGASGGNVVDAACWLPRVFRLLQRDHQRHKKNHSPPHSMMVRNAHCNFFHYLHSYFKTLQNNSGVVEKELVGTRV